MTHVYWKFTCDYIYSHDVCVHTLAHTCKCSYIKFSIKSIKLHGAKLIDRQLLSRKANRNRIRNRHSERRQEEREGKRDSERNATASSVASSTIVFFLVCRFDWRTFGGPTACHIRIRMGVWLCTICVYVCVCAWACSACLPLQLPTLASGWLVQYSGLLQGHKNAFDFHARCWLRQWSTTATTTTKTIENVKSFHSLNRTSTHSRAYSRDTSNNKLTCSN